MRAIVYVEKGRVEVWNHLQAPELGADEVQLKTLYTAVTVGTERNVLMGGPYSGPFPIICGYQTVSRVVEKGSDIRSLDIGDLVFSDFGSQPVNFTGTCWGGHIETRNRKETGNIVKLDPGIDPQEATLLGAMCVGLKAAKRGQVTIHDRVLVVGLGLIGQACAQAAAAMGADVYGIDAMPERLSLASRLSCSGVWDARLAGAWEAIRKSGEFDVVFESTGLEEMPDRALQSLRRGTGRMVAIGGKLEMKYRNLDSGQSMEATLIHTSHFGREELEDLVRLMRRGRIKTGPMITHRPKLSEAPGIYEKIVRDPSGLLGVVFEWNRE